MPFPAAGNNSVGNVREMNAWGSFRCVTVQLMAYSSGPKSLFVACLYQGIGRAGVILRTCLLYVFYISCYSRSIFLLVYSKSWFDSFMFLFSIVLEEILIRQVESTKNQRKLTQIAQASCGHR